ncbi:MAG: HD domain-containing protein [Candidatus Diapherotrites archaeon]
MYLEEVVEQKPDLENLVFVMERKFYNFDVKSLELIKKAYLFAENAHKDQKRASGEPYFIHPYNVAYIIANFGMCPESVAAGLLHDVLEDTPVTKKELEVEFGKEITELVEGVTKLDQITAHSKTDKELSALQKMLFSVAKDFRVIVVKLADKIHNLRTIEYLPVELQKQISNFALDVYAPLAHKLGIHSMRNEIEKLAFPVARPELNAIVDRQIAPLRAQRAIEFKKMIEKLDDAIKKTGKNASFEIHEKSNYQIRRKMARNPLESITDCSVLVIKTKKVEDCYNVLGILHSLYFPIPNNFTDKIHNPSGLDKLIATNVIGSDGSQCSISIRTEEMDNLIKKGVIAYIYDPQKMYNLVRKRIYNLEYILEDAVCEGFLETLQTDLLRDTISVFTNEGDVLDLPFGSTPLDFAYFINSELANKSIGARVNGKSVPLWYNLKEGDKIELMFAEFDTVNKHWLDFVRLNKTKKEIEKKLGVTEPTFTTKNHCNFGEVTIQLSARDRIGLLADITKVFADERINIKYVLSEFPRKDMLRSSIIAEVDSANKTNILISKLSDIPNILEVNSK